MCCSFDSFLCVWSKSIFQQSYPIPTYESRDWVMCCSFVIPFFVFGLKSIFNLVLHLKAGLSDVLLFVIPFFTFGLKVFSTVLPNFYLWKLSDVLLFLWFPFFVFGLKVFFNSPTISTYESRIEWCAALCDSLSLVLRVFSTVLPNFYLWKQGLSDVLLFCDSFLYVWS
jgi:hypothetical protein